MKISSKDDVTRNDCSECGYDAFYVYDNSILVCTGCGHPHKLEELT